jgi:hypothetical protein
MILLACFVIGESQYDDLVEGNPEGVKSEAKEGCSRLALFSSIFSDGCCCPSDLHPFALIRLKAVTLKGDGRQGVVVVVAPRVVSSCLYRLFIR